MADGKFLQVHRNVLLTLLDERLHEERASLRIRILGRHHIKNIARLVLWFVSEVTGARCYSVMRMRFVKLVNL